MEVSTDWTTTIEDWIKFDIGDSVKIKRVNNGFIVDVDNMPMGIDRPDGQGTFVFNTIDGVFSSLDVVQDPLLPEKVDGS